MRVLTSLCCAVALAILLVPGARADENDRLTYMTFSGPVQVPGVTLAAGTYTFKIADGAASRHVVQIFSKDDNKLITQVMTIPNERLEPVKDTFVMFQERPAGVPVAVKAWFYPGRSIGEEFLYPKQQALSIARASGDSVLSTEGDVTDSSAKVGHINERGEIASATSTTAPAASTTASKDSTTTAPKASTTTAPKASAKSSTDTAPAPVAEVQAPPSATVPAPAEERPVVGTSGQVPTPASEPAPAAAPARRLPRTASPLALFELVSALSIAGGVGLRQLRKRV